MTEPDLTALVEQLQAENRRWKWLAILSTAALSVLLTIGIAGGTLLVTAARAQALHARDAERAARMVAEEARQEAIRERDRAEKARQDARKVLYQARIHLAEEALVQAGDGAYKRQP